MTWLAFAHGVETDYLLAIVTLFFVIFFALFLFTATYSRGDPRWPTRQTSFREFLDGKVSTATGEERGRDVLIEIAAAAGRARLWGDAYRPGLGDFRLSSDARASSVSRVAAKPPATHSAST